MTRVRIVSLGFLFSTISSVLAPAFGQANPDTGVVGRCTANCGPYPDYTGPTASQPSQEDLQRQLQAKDQQEAADDALDRGVAAYRKGDYALAIQKFEESLKYQPNDPVALNNLAKARGRLSEIKGLAARQAAATKAGQADATFDGRQGAKDVGGIRVDPSAVVAGPSFGDPVVPPDRRTPEITAFESQRTDLRAKIATIETEIKALDPSRDAVAIGNKRQKREKAANEVHYLNFSISEALRAPPAPKPKP